jgi:hypothetical protein
MTSGVRCTAFDKVYLYRKKQQALSLKLIFIQLKKIALGFPKKAAHHLSAIAASTEMKRIGQHETLRN